MMSTTITPDGVRAVTDATFADEIERHDGLALVDCWATWCGPCRMLAPVVEQIAADHAGRLRVAKLDADANEGTTIRFGVRSLPTLLLFRDGQLVDRIVGAVPRAVIERKLAAHLGAAD